MQTSLNTVAGELTDRNTTMHVRFSAVTRIGAAVLLASALFPGPAGPQAGHEAMNGTDDLDALQALVDTQTEAETRAIVESCGPSTALVDVATGEILAAIQLPSETAAFADALRNPTSAQRSDCGGAGFGYSPFAFGSLLARNYG